jgi:hypothetical protein
MIRELTLQEKNLVAGAGWWRNGYYYSIHDIDWDGEADVVEKWTGDPNVDGEFISDTRMEGGFFASVGVSFGPAGGGVTVGGGDIYVYGSVGVGATPVDISFGYSNDLENYLGGYSVSGNGMPGAGLSFDEEGNLTATAWQVGTPGVSASYEISLTDVWNQLESNIRDFVDESYIRLGSPYDPEGGGNDWP